jgi:hypothetical protein
MGSRSPNFFNISNRIESNSSDFYEFGSIGPNSKNHGNIEKIRFGSARFDIPGKF